MAKTFNLTAQINLQGPANIKPIVAQIRRELGTINTAIDIKFDTKAAKGVDNLSQKIQSLNSILIETTKNSQILASSLNNLGTSIKGLGSIGKVNSSVSKTAQSITSTAKAVKTASSEMEEFGKQSALAVRRFAAFSVVSAGVFSLVNAVRNGTKAFIEFDKQLIRLQQVTGGGSVGIKLLRDEIINLATTLGVSSESLTEVAVTLAQAGLSAKETQQALAALAKTELAPSFDNMTETTEGAIAAMRQFSIETKDLEKVLGSINAVAAAFAVESSDIITAIQRAGGAFAASSKGVTEGADALNEFIAIFTSVRATTRESAETIATGLRTIFTRIQRGSTIDFLREFNVELTDSEGKFVGPYEGVKRLSEVLKTLDPRDLRFSQIVEELGGFRQIGKVIPLIQQFGEAQKALGVAQRGQGSLTDAQVKAQQSLANQIAKVREQFLALSYAVGESQTFKSLFKIVIGLTSGLIKLASVFKPLLPLIATLGIIQGGKALTKFGSGFISGIKKGGGAGGVGTNLGESLSGVNSEKTAIAAEKTASALTDNTKSLTTLTTAVESLTQAINSRGSATLNNGGKVMAFARGGTVPGSGNRDTVPAMLMPGEFVIRKKAVEKLGTDNLHKMNKYAYGGTVKDLSKYYKSIPTKKGYENLENQPIKDNSIFREVKPTDLTTDQIEEWRGSDIPRWKKFEYVLSKNYNLGPPASEQFALLDFPQSRSEAKFMKKGDTYDDYDSIKGNNEATIAAKNFLYENSLLSGKANLKPDELITRAIANKPVTTYWADPTKFAAQGLNKGGLIQKFLSGGTVEETAKLENITAQESVIAWLKELGGIQGVKDISGIASNDRTLDSILRLNNIKSGDSTKLDKAMQAIDRALSNQTAKKVREAQSINKSLKLGIVGLEPLGFNQDRVFDTGFGKAALLLRGLPNSPEYADLVGKTRAGIGKLSTDLASGLQNATAFGGSQPIALDFDETLVKGADIFGPDGKPDIPGYDDLNRVKEALKNGQPTELAEKLKSIMDFDPSFIDRIRVLTARPQESANLLAEKLNSIGLPIPASKIQGTRGGGSTKASKLGVAEKLIDDNYDNILAAIAQGKTAKQYKELREIEDAEQRAGGIANAEGAVLQLALSQLGAEGGTIKEAAIDFERGLGLQASQIFGLPPDIPTEVKRTLSSAAIGRAEDEFTRYFKENSGPFPKGSDAYGFSKNTGLPVSKFASGGEVYSAKQLVSLAKYRTGNGPGGGTNSEFINRYLEDNDSFLEYLKTFHADPTKAYDATKNAAKDMLEMFSNQESMSGSKRSGKLYSTVAGGKLKTLLTQINNPLNSNKDISDAIGKSFNLNGSLLSTSESPDTASMFQPENGSSAMLSILRNKNIPSIDVDKTVFDTATEDDVIKSLSKYMDPVSGKSGADYLSRSRSATRIEKEFILPPSSKFRIDDIDRIYSKDQEDKLLGGNIRHIEGMKVQQFAKGGSPQDTVPALLTPGEFVINKKAAQKIGYGKLHQMNKADKIQGYNKGGSVGLIQKFADGGDVRETQDWADALRAIGNSTLPDLDDAIEEVAKQFETLGKLDVSKALRQAINPSLNRDEQARAIGGSARNTAIYENNSVKDSSGNITNANPGLDALAASIERNIEAQKLFTIEAERASMSLQDFESKVKSQNLEKALSGINQRQDSRSLLRRDFIKSRLTGLDTPEKLSGARDTLVSSLSELLKPDEVEKAIDAIISGAEAGQSLEDVAKTSDEVKKALDASIDRTEALSKAEQDLIDNFGELTNSVRITAEELAAFEYQKSGRAQSEFGMLGSMNPGGALAFKNSRLGGGLLSAAQNFQQTAGLGRLPIIGKGIGSLGKALENLPGPIGSAVKAIGGLPGAFAALTSIIGSEFIPMILKAANSTDSELGAGIGGALAQGGSMAVSLGTLGNQLAGPIGAAVGTIGGAVAGAIKGFSDSIRTKALENALKGLTAQIEKVDTAFDFLSKKQTSENIINAQKETIGLQENINKLSEGINPSVGQRAADAGYYGTLATVGTFLAGLGLVVGGGALGATGAAATVTPAAPLGAAGVAAGGYMITAGGAMMTASPSVGAVVGGGAAAMNLRDDINDESLQGHLKAVTAYVEGIGKLSEIQIKLKSLGQLEDITKTINQIDKDAQSGKIDQNQADKLKTQEYIRIGKQSSSIEQAQRGALIKSGKYIDPNKDLNQQIGNDQNLRDIANVTADTTAYNIALEELSRRYDANTEAGRNQILKEMKDKDKLIKRGYELAGILEFQSASTQRLTLLTKQMSIETENLVEAYNRALAGIGRFKNELENFVLKTEQNASFFTGEGGMGQTDRTQEQMLRNMTAYTAQELAPVLDNVTSLAGGGEQGKKLTDSIKASKIMQDVLPGILRNADARDVGGVTKELDKTLKAAGIGDAVRSTLVDELRQYLDKETANRSGDSFQEVIANFPALADAINTAKKAQEVGIAILEAQNDALDQVNKQLDQYNKYLKQSLQWSIKADQIRLQGAIDLDRALGRTVSLDRLNAPIENEIKALSGINSSDPVAIANQIRADQARAEAINGTNGQPGLMDQAKARGEAGKDEVAKLAKEQADLARASSNAYEALEKLATSGDIASNVLSKIEEERQLGKNFIDFARKVSTQSAEESIRMNRSFAAFEQTVAGNMNFGNRENRQLAYEGMDTLLPLIRGSTEGNQLIAQFTKNMLAGQGVDLNKKFGNTGSTVGELIDKATTGIDPGTTQLIELYKEAKVAQEQAARELANLNGSAANKYLESTATILNNLYNNLPAIIASALLDPQKAANGQVQAPALQNNAQLPNVPPDPNKPIPVVVQNAQQAGGLANGAPVVGQNIAGPANAQAFNAMATTVPKLDLTMLNTIRSIDTLNIGIVNLGTTVKDLADKLTDSSAMADAVTIFDNSTIFFGSKVDIFDKATVSFGSYVDKLSTTAGLLSNAKITMGGNYTVDVKVSGAAAFQAIEEKTQKLIDTGIGLEMDKLIVKIKKATGMSLDLDRRAP